jgi:MFS family permease
MFHLRLFKKNLVDNRVGVKTCLLLFVASITAGQSIFSLGVSEKSWPLMFLGCIVMGLGGESFSVANSALLSEWFKGGELAFAFGVNLSIAKLGSVINDLVSPRLADRVNIQFASSFGVILCGVAITSILLVLPIDQLVSEQLNNKITNQQTENATIYQLLSPLTQTDWEHSDHSEHHDSNTTSGRDSSAKSSAESGESPSSHPSQSLDTTSASIPTSTTQPSAPTFRDVLNLSVIFWMLVLADFAIYGCILPFNNISSSYLLERDYFITPPHGCALIYPNQCPSTLNTPNSIRPPSHSSSDWNSLWYQPPLPNNYTSSSSFNYNPLTTDDIDCTSNFWKNACASKEYCNKLNQAEKMASFVMTIPYAISAILSPIFGLFIDFFGMRAVIATIAPLILIIIHSLLAYTTITPIALLIGQGLAYTGFAAVLWPAVPVVMEERMTGIGFGIAMSANNLASAAVPVMIATIYADDGDRYIPNVEYLFLALASLGVCTGLYMNYYDANHHHILNGTYFCSRNRPEDSVNIDDDDTDSEHAGKITVKSKLHEQL